tara:strand:- start:720 stop:1472 length:753 start_codon:yes stop_codon:yes gene_type:complete
MLNETQINQFKKDGFVLVPKLFNKQEIESILRYTEDLQNAPEISGKEWKYFEKSKINKDEKVLSRIENFCKYHQGFNDLCTKSRIMECVNSCLGEKGVLFKDKINFKMSGGNGFDPHQDSQAGWDDYAKFYITAMVSVDESTVQNGCLEFAPGHNKFGLIGELWKPLSDDDMKNMKFVPIETKPGDAVFFDCYAPHKSEPNLTNKSRRILYLTYNKLSDGDHKEIYYKDKYKNYPPDVDRDPSKNYTFRV